MDITIAELYSTFKGLSGSKNGSFDDIRDQLSDEIVLKDRVVVRGACHDLNLNLSYGVVDLSISATTDMRTYNVYPGVLTYAGKEYRYTYSNDAVEISGGLNLGLETRQIISKLIQRVIEVY